MSRRVNRESEGGMAGSHQQRRRILVIEDDEALASSLQRLLELEGFEVQVQHAGNSAVLQAAERQPDLVILDLRLPDLHGYRVCEELRKLYHSWVIPVVMLTGMDAPIDKLRGFAHGADAYLTKPCDRDELIRTVRQLLGEATLV